MLTHGGSVRTQTHAVWHFRCSGSTMGFQVSCLLVRLELGDALPLATDDDYSGKGLRFALIVGLGGIALIFLGRDPLTRCGCWSAMRTENKILRAEALQRTNYLASIRSSVLVCHSYVGRDKASEYLTKVEDRAQARRGGPGELSPKHD